jgi:hypothetical protein
MILVFYVRAFLTPTHRVIVASDGALTRARYATPTTGPAYQGEPCLVPTCSVKFGLPADPRSCESWLRLREAAAPPADPAEAEASPFSGGNSSFFVCASGGGEGIIVGTRAQSGAACAGPHRPAARNLDEAAKFG